jgi:ribosome biogenesis protein NSA1
MRLNAWHVSSDATTFAYGGNEVDLSMWDTERAFQTNQSGGVAHAQAESRKRKRDALLPGEIWRAKNVRHSIFRESFDIDIVDTC